MARTRKWIVNGDRTDHGGTVIASITSSAYGKPFARVGDQLYCPKCKKSTTIIQGDATMIVLGQPQAYEGCYTSCGAKLVSVQQHTTFFVDGAGGKASSSDPTSALMSELDADPTPLAAKKPVCLECLLAAAQRATAVLGR